MVVDKKIKLDEDPNYVANLVAQNKKTQDATKIKRKLILGSTIGLLGYSAYKIPKLPDHKNYETLKVVGVIGGSAILLLSSISWSMGQNKIKSLSFYSSISLGAGGISYLALRSLLNKDISSSLKIAAIIGLSVGGYFYYNSEIKPNINKKVEVK